MHDLYWLLFIGLCLSLSFACAHGTRFVWGQFFKPHPVELLTVGIRRKLRQPALCGLALILTLLTIALIVTAVMASGNLTGKIYLFTNASAH